MIIPRTTVHLSIPRPALLVARLRSWLLQRDPIALISVTVITLIVALSSLRSAWPQPKAQAAQSTPALAYSIIIATAQPQRATVSADRIAQLPSGHTLARAVVAYDAPNGNVIGAIDSGHAYTVVARFGADWLQADVVSSGTVWLRASDVFDLPSNLADLQPTAAPQTVYVSAPAAPAQTTYRADSQPAAAPTLTSDERQQALDREFGVMTDADRQAALDAHNAREDAWCAAHPENVNCIAVDKLAATATAQAAQP